DQDDLQGAALLRSGRLRVGRVAGGILLGRELLRRELLLWRRLLRPKLLGRSRRRCELLGRILLRGLRRNGLLGSGGRRRFDHGCATVGTELA
ncbi:MAG TPA: hypothetical protein VD902_10275, partial [Symbiobacteriaceae bacterium]|nr:hypothetical protein [Symbiobacteriaceae bacterium]